MTPSAPGWIPEHRTKYRYDKLGQVISGRKYWQDWTPVAGQQFEYGFDDIGNRTITGAGGDETGRNLRVANYGANTLNQYTNREVPGAADIMGISFATNTVSVNSNTAYRKGEYFRFQQPITNGTAPQWSNIIISATGQTSVTGKVFVAMTPEQFLYDADGNLTNDGRWTYMWDAENRLVNMTSLSGAPVGSKLKMDFLYDWQGRRIQKLVSTNNGSVYGSLYTNRFAYDGWNLMATLNPQLSTLNTFTWGLDLSGSMQGAGGVGGLLIAAAITNSQFVAYDGNGNVSALLDSGSGASAATYEYGPFGELLRATGPACGTNPFRFSTKYQDDQTDLLCYGYRYYTASAGRWLSRDPMDEGGGINLYFAVKNEPTEIVDILGLDYHESITSETSANISNTYGPVYAYTGDASGPGLATPHPVPSSHNVIIRQGCCAEVDRAQQVDVNVRTVLPNDAVGVVYTSDGFRALQGHEERRRIVYKRAYDAYIEPVQANGSLVRKCRKICTARAKELLQDYLNKLQAQGIANYNRWVSLFEQRITQESFHWETVGGLRDHFSFVARIPDPPPLPVVTCPSP